MPSLKNAMQLATWNVNSLKVRLPQVLDWLSNNPVDALCLQELKLDHDKFPLAAFTEIGYHAAWTGQKTYNGVAIISRQPGAQLVRNIPGFEDPQQRIVAVTLPFGEQSIRVICAYCPNGQAVDSEKYVYKLSWFKALEQWLAQEKLAHPYLTILGDYNVAPTDEDVHDPAKWDGQILVSPAERDALGALFDLDFHDAFRLFDQPPKTFSWWDYRMNGFKRNAGMRIDHVLLSGSLVPHCTACIIDKGPRALEQPSDHAPVIATLTV